MLGKAKLRSTLSLRALPASPLKQNTSNVGRTDDNSLSSSEATSSIASSFSLSSLQVIASLPSLASCPLVMFQAPQHFRSSETQATCYSCFARRSAYISSRSLSLDFSMPGIVHPQQSQSRVKGEWGEWGTVTPCQAKLNTVPQTNDSFWNSQSPVLPLSSPSP